MAPACPSSELRTTSTPPRSGMKTTVRRAISARMGSSSKSPAFATPPPITIACGFRTQISPASARPSMVPACWKIARAVELPRSAACAIWSGVGCRLPSSSSSSVSPASMAAQAARTRAGPLVSVSRHPIFPQLQRRPSGTTVMCPISPAAPRLPRKS